MAAFPPVTLFRCPTVARTPSMAKLANVPPQSKLLKTLWKEYLTSYFLNITLFEIKVLMYKHVLRGKGRFSINLLTTIAIKRIIVFWLYKRCLMVCFTEQKTSISPPYTCSRISLCLCFLWVYTKLYIIMYEGPQGLPCQASISVAVTTLPDSKSSPHRYNPSSLEIIWINTSAKRSTIVHADVNAIIQAHPELWRLTGCN